MRTSSQDTEILYTEDGQFLGVNLGWDHVAEHEHNIKGICGSFGIDSELRRDNMGTFRLTPTEVPENDLVLDVVGDCAILALCRYLGWDNDPEKRAKKIKHLWQPGYSHECAAREDETRHVRVDGEYVEQPVTVKAAWSGEDFGIWTRGEENCAKLKELHDAMLRKDVVIGVGSRANPFANGGLIIMIKSKVPADWFVELVRAETDTLDMLEEAERLGIKELIDDLNRQENLERTDDSYRSAAYGYYALSPSWVGPARAEETEFKVWFWLNSQNQDKINSTWCTVEDLVDWIHGEGKIPKKPEFGTKTRVPLGCVPEPIRHLFRNRG